MSVDEPRAEEFVFDTPGKANWALSKILKIRQRCDLFVQAAEEEIARLEAQIEETERKRDQESAYLLSELDSYLDTVPAKKAKTQISFELPAGKLVRKLPSTDYVRDDKRLLKALAGTDYVKDEPSLKWAELKKDLKVVGETVVLSTTGEALDGISVVEKPATFDVK